MNSRTQEENNQASQLPRAIVIWSTVGIFSIGLLIAVLGIAPLYKTLVMQQKQHMATQVNSVATTVQEYITRIEDIAVQITSRTKAREKLEAYNDGKIGLAELNDFSIPVLNDALNLKASLQGITRLDKNGKVAVETGTSVSSVQLAELTSNISRATIQGPYKVQNEYIVVVIAPILNRYNIKVGTDVVFFNFGELQQILKNYTLTAFIHDIYLSQKINGNLAILFKPGSDTDLDISIDTISFINQLDNLQLTENTGMIDDQGDAGSNSIIAYHLFKDINWLLTLRASKDVLYKPIYKEISTYFVLLIIITMIGSITVYLGLRPLRNKLITLTSNLKEEINERNKIEKSLAERASQQAAIADFGQIALSGKPIQELMDIMIKRIAGVLGVEFAKFLQLQHEDNFMLLRSGFGWEQDLIGNSTVAIDEDSQAGYTLKSNEPVVVANLKEDERFNGPQILKDHGIISGMSVIIHGHDSPWGVLGVHTRHRRDFTQDDINFIQSAANIIAEVLERRQTIEELTKFSRAVEQSPSLVMITDINGEIEYINPRFTEVTGYKLSEIIGKNANILSSGENPPEFFKDMWHAIKQGNEWHGEYQNKKKNGDLYWSKEIISPIKNAQGDVIHYLSTSEDITETLRLSDELKHQASHDPLTGLANRRVFEQRLVYALDSAQIHNAEHALCYLDLDQFKVINDTCGHIAGDHLLRQIGDVISKRIRKQDTLARLGGDEFGILMEFCNLQQAEVVANKIRQEIEEFRFVWENHSFAVGVSIGLVPILHSSNSTTDILSRADTACYAAKDTGRNRIHIYQEDDIDLARRKGEMQWVARINQALDENRFRLYIQPIIPIIQNDLEKNKHYEVLLRMEEVDKTIVPPGAFLPAAERYNLAKRLDMWVIDTIFKIIKQPLSFNAELGLFAINLSGQSIADADFLEFVIERLSDSSIADSRICFEITETAAIANLSMASRFINEVKKFGCRFALDDFGSGLSSFAYLKTLPVDYLKIDGIFVKDIAEDPTDYAMVKSIHEVGKALGKDTIAEFVENDAILAKLNKIGVDYAQGYGIGKPFPIKDLIPMNDDIYATGI